ncbi:MAG: MFS transporter [Planctomycetaceae bacterium]
MNHNASNSAALNRACRKAYLRLLPLLFVCYVIAYIDRVNVGFAKLQMREALNFSETVFSIGMGIFFIGYLLLEIPGTLLVERWSAKKWISRIMITWGIFTILTAWVKTPLQFYTVRFLLGVAEAGFFPGVIVYLTHWFPRSQRTKALAWFFIGTPLAQIIGPPISEWLMRIGVDSPAVLGLVGWQWVFVFWGLPAMLLGLVVLFWLTDRPHQAHWLTEEERQALESTLAEDRAALGGGHSHMTIGEALMNRKVVALSAAYFFVVTGNYGVELYLPTIFKAWYNLDFKDVAYLVVIPPIGSVIGQLLVGWNSDRTGERRWHATLPIVLGAIALAATPFSEGTLWLTVALFTLAMTGLKAYLPAFWSLPSLFLTATAAAASIGMINSFGNLGGAVGPITIGFLKDALGEFKYGIWFLSGSMLVSSVVIFSLRFKSESNKPEAELTNASCPNASESSRAPRIEPSAQA